MKAVGIRELKNRLSEYLRLVRGGEEVLVTDRGEVVAELRQPSRSLTDPPHPGLMKLVKQGKARLGAPHRSDLYPRLPALLSRGELARLIADERADG
ncbi:MAG: type II toxin-antitoxin system prevent-host-death family antitoxin [candidate division NC10 bacterium]|nr:type II toxin-antitoxin system prevent-host-death family antitoxin [candidate division NC10 bacterium]